MPAATARDRAVFDHETEAPRRRRRRPAPDWGGDDLFDHVPRRRFSRGEDGAPAHHRPAAAAEPAAVAVAQVPAPAPAARPAPVEELIAARKAEYTPDARRTITITGRPGHAFAPRTSGGPARTRGPRTVEQRIGTRPDQIAAWACALGVLLILLALLT